jgi:hypothetical protein
MLLTATLQVLLNLTNANCARGYTTDAIDVLQAYNELLRLTDANVEVKEGLVTVIESCEEYGTAERIKQRLTEELGDEMLTAVFARLRQHGYTL